MLSNARTDSDDDGEQSDTYSSLSKPSHAGLKLVGLNQRFGPRWGARDLNLDVPSGKLLVLLGPSGSGKSTTINIIAGFQKPDSGRVLIDGQDITDVPTHKRNFGMVFQANTLFPHMSVEENIRYGMKLRKMSLDEQKKTVAELLALIGLEGREQAHPGQLSGGEQQRVALARALALRPRLLLLDEPLSALDAKLRRRLREEIRAIQLRTGVTTVMVTHDQEEALALGDIVAVMNDGVLQQADTPERLYTNPDNAFVSGFVGESNLVDAEIASIDDRRVAIKLGDGRIVHARRTEKTTAPGQAVLMVLRPDEISIDSNPAGGPPPASDSAVSTLTGVVRVAQFLGSKRRYVVELGEGAPKLDVDALTSTALNPGDAVVLRWQSDNVIVFPT